jgi:hypothetical protein
MAAMVRRLWWLEFAGWARSTWQRVYSPVLILLIVIGGLVTVHTAARAWEQSDRVVWALHSAVGERPTAVALVEAEQEQRRVIVGFGVAWVTFFTWLLTYLLKRDDHRIATRADERQEWQGIADGLTSQDPVRRAGTLETFAMYCEDIGRRGDRRTAVRAARMISDIARTRAPLARAGDATAAYELVKALSVAPVLRRAAMVVEVSNLSFDGLHVAMVLDNLRFSDCTFVHCRGPVLRDVVFLDCDLSGASLSEPVSEQRQKRGTAPGSRIFRHCIFSDRTHLAPALLDECTFRIAHGASRSWVRDCFRAGALIKHCIVAVRSDEFVPDESLPSGTVTYAGEASWSKRIIVIDKRGERTSVDWKAGQLVIDEKVRGG